MQCSGVGWESSVSPLLLGTCFADRLASRSPADTGAVGGKLLGLVTSRDWDFVNDLHTPLGDIMTTDIETAQYGA